MFDVFAYWSCQYASYPPTKYVCFCPTLLINGEYILAIKRKAYYISRLTNFLIIQWLGQKPRQVRKKASKLLSLIIEFMEGVVVRVRKV